MYNCFLPEEEKEGIYFENMSLEEDHNLTPAEIKKSAPLENPEIDNVVTLPERQELIDRVGLASVEHAVVARTPMDPASIIDTDGKLAHRSDLINQFGIEAVKQGLAPTLAAGGTPQPPKDPSIIPPQTEPMAPYLHPTQEVGFGAEKNIAETTKEFEKKVVDWLPHSPIGRLASRAERAGMRIWNSPQEAFYGVMYRWRAERATGAEMEYRKYAKEIADKNTILAQADASRAAMIETQRAAGMPTMDIAVKLESERTKALKDIEKIQKQHDRAGKQLEDLNARKASWAQKENNLAERTMVKIDQRIAPDKGAFDALVAQKEEAGKKLESLKRARDMGHQGLQELEAKLTLDPSLINKVAIPDKIQAVKDLLEKIDAEYNQHTKAVSGIDSKMRKANNFLSGWVGYRNEEARVSTQDRRTFNPGDQNIEAAIPHEAPNLTHAPEPKAPERGHTVPTPEKTVARTTSGGTSIESAIESKESLKEATPEAYLGQWNKLFGKDEANFDLKTFTEYSKLKPKEVVPVEKIENALNEILTKGVTGAALIYAKEGIKARCMKVRQALQEGDPESAATK